MTQLIDKYIYNVIKRLPDKLKEEVSLELNTNIYDMLDNDLSEIRIKEVLTDLGDPKLLALSYQNKTGALISGDRYIAYMSMLTNVLIVLGILGAIIGTLQGLDQTAHQETFKRVFMVLGYVLLFFIGFEVIGYAGVTFLFHIDSLIDRRQTKTWTLEDLEDIPAKFKRYTKKLVNIWFSVQLLLGLLGSYLMWKQPSIIFGVMPFFEQNIASIFFPLFILMMLFALVVAFMKIKAGKSTITVAIVNTIYYVTASTVVIVFLLQDHLWTQTIIEHVGLNTLNLITTTLSITAAVLIAIHIYVVWIKTIKKG